MATTLTTNSSFNPFIAFGIPDYTPKTAVKNAYALNQLARDALKGAVVTENDLAQIGLGKMRSFTSSQTDFDQDGIPEMDFVINFSGLDSMAQDGSVHFRLETGSMSGSQDIWIDTSYTNYMFAQSANVHWHTSGSDGTSLPILSRSEEIGLSWKNGQVYHTDLYANGKLVFDTTYMVDVVGIPILPTISPIGLDLEDHFTIKFVHKTGFYPKKERAPTYMVGLFSG